MSTLRIAQCMASSLDRLLGPGVICAEPDGSLRISDAALGAQLHSTRRRCYCLRCSTGREADGIAALASYLALLESERPRDEDEIARVRALMPAPAPAPVRQPWEPEDRAVAGHT
jgi:hypothetical protein